MQARQHGRDDGRIPVCREGRVVGEQLVRHDDVGIVGGFVHHVDERARLVRGRGVDELAQHLEQLRALSGMRAHGRRVGDQLSNFVFSEETALS